MKVTRRDLFVWGAGAAAGMVFSPVPWKLLDDVSIWTQNWPWIPQPPHGPIEVKQSFCTLCPQGCAMKVKMAGGCPVGVAGVSGNPVTRGALCPLAFGVHQLNWHPQRLRAVRHKRVSSSWSEARAAFAKACGEGPIVIVDGRPGSAASSVLASFAEEQKGSYRVALSLETRALLPYEAMVSPVIPASALGYDLERAQTIVSFGAPLLDGWGIPGRFTRLWSERAAGMSEPQLRLIQIEDSLSRTATRAWRWVAIRPGSKNALAAGLARVLVEEHLVSARGPLSALTVSDAALQTNLSESAIRDLARTMVAKPPVLAIAGDERPEIAALNFILGSVGSPGGIVRRSKPTEKYELANAAIPNARAVLIDASVPWDYAPPTDAEIFRFAAWDGGSNRADWLLPAPGFLEEFTDVNSAPTSAVETYGVAPQLTKPMFEIHSAAQFLSAIDSSFTNPETIIHQRCADLFRERAGTVYGQEIMPVAELDSAQKFEAELSKAALWVADAPKSASLLCELKEWPSTSPAESPRNWSAAWAAAVLPPLATKLYRESSLREAPDRRTA